MLYPAPEQVRALPRYLPPQGMPVLVPDPLPMALRAQTQRTARETVPEKPWKTAPRLPARILDPSVVFKALPDPLAGHPRPNTVTSIFRLDNVKPQSSHPPVKLVQTK